MDTQKTTQDFLDLQLQKLSVGEKLRQTFEMSHFVLQQAKRAVLKQKLSYVDIFYSELKNKVPYREDVFMTTESKNEILEALTPFLKAVEELGLEYQVVGSVASSAYGAARSTRDIDLVCALSAPKVADLISYLKDEYYVDEDMIHEAIRSSGSFNLIHLKTMFKLDVFILKNSPYDLKSFSRKRKEPLDSENALQIYLSSPEDTIIAKLHWYRLGGENSERQLQDIEIVVRIQNKSLDLQYIENWCKELKLLDLWQKIAARTVS